MFSFWLIVIMMLLLALIVVLRTLLLVPDKKPELPEDIAVELYKTRKAEIERDVEYGTLKPEQLAATYEELDRALLQDVHSVTTKKIITKENQKRDWWTAGIITMLIPVVAISIYLILGKPELIEQSIITTATETKGLPSVEVMVGRLAARLEMEPDSQQGWFTLAQSYMAMGKYSEAVDAYYKLYKLTGDQPGVLLGYADALAMANNGRVSGKPEEYIQKVLELEPDNSKGLWLAGIAANERGDNELAIDYWQRLLAKLPFDSPNYQEVKQLISRTEAQLNGELRQPDAVVSNNVTDNKQDITIKINVQLAPHLVEKTKSDDTLFIFARAVSGPAMPIAVVRKQVSDLPLKVTLDDSVAMMQSRKLSDFEEVFIGARISKNGNALPESGDFLAELKLVRMSQDEIVNLVIDQLIP